MGISIFQPPPIPMDKVERGHAVTASGAVEAIDDRVLSEITQLVCQDLRVSASLFSILHQDTQYVVAAHGFPTGAYRRKTRFQDMQSFLASISSSCQSYSSMSGSLMIHG